MFYTLVVGYIIYLLHIKRYLKTISTLKLLESASAIIILFFLIDLLLGSLSSLEIFYTESDRKASRKENDAVA